mmetsp:Transcript_4042/g.8946  ORF Transcript_4042/g.8946 Transcript_4042/m.8946 type:complete len:153 (-) Transcript_4042:73-531(-)
MAIKGLLLDMGLGMEESDQTQRIGGRDPLSYQPDQKPDPATARSQRLGRNGMRLNQRESAFRLPKCASLDSNGVHFSRVLSDTNSTIISGCEPRTVCKQNVHPSSDRFFAIWSKCFNFSPTRKLPALQLSNPPLASIIMAGHRATLPLPYTQ